MTADDMAALADACEKACDTLLGLCWTCQIGREIGEPGESCEYCDRLRAEMTRPLSAHARAIREGRVTVQEDA